MGNVIKLNKLDERRALSVKAAPMAPNSDKHKVPNAKLPITTPTAEDGMAKLIAAKGARSIKVTPLKNQCTAILHAIKTHKGWGDSTHCSKTPSSKSLANSRSSDKVELSKAATHNTPGAKVFNRSGVGLKLKGNSVTTKLKNTKG